MHDFTRAGQECAVEKALHDVAGPSRDESGCLGLNVFRSTRDLRLFIHAHWSDEAAFEIHARLPHTVRFIDTAELLIDHLLDLTRTTMLV